MSESEPAEAHLIFLRSGLLLSKRRYAGWREIQDDFDDYMASLGPWTAEGIGDHFALDYGADDSAWPLTQAQISEFFRSSAEVIKAP